MELLLPSDEDGSGNLARMSQLLHEYHLAPLTTAGVDGEFDCGRGL
jgi:hypothetical protein